MPPSDSAPSLGDRATTSAAPLVLSSGQRRLWFVDRLRGGRSPEYNTQVAHRLRGPVDVAALERSIETIVARHEVLRTCFAEVDDEPAPIVLPPQRIPLVVDDLGGAHGERSCEDVASVMRADGAEPFSLRHGPLLRVRLTRLGPDEHLLLRTVHHIAFDGWSNGVWNREQAALYGAFRHGRPDPLTPLPHQYADYAQWEQRHVQGRAFERGLEYWSRQLASAPEQHALPMERRRPPALTSIGDRLAVHIAPDLLSAVRHLSRAHRTTLYMTLLAALGIVVARHSGQDDLVIGSPVANRPDRRVTGLIGYFVNFVPMRIRLSRAMTVVRVLEQVQHVALDAFQHQDVPFERLVAQLGAARRLDVPPVFQIMFSLQNMPAAPFALDGLDVTSVARPTHRARVDLEVYATERGDHLEVGWLYNTDLFDRWRIALLARHFEGVLAAMVADCQQTVSRIPLIDPPITPAAAAHGRRKTDALDGGPIPGTVVALFERHAAEHRDSVAVIAADSSISYGELNARSNRLARILVRRGVGPERFVAIACERSIAMVTAMLATLKAGAAYIPLDMTDPRDRLERTIREGKPVCILATSQTIAAGLGEAPRLVVDDPAILVESRHLRAGDVTDEERTSRLEPGHPAYLITTSGSSGVPKCVVGLHEGLVDRSEWFRTEFRVEPGMRVLAKTSMGFIDGTIELLGSLMMGGLVVLATDEAFRSVAGLARLVREHRIQQVTLVPSLLRVLLGEWSAEDLDVCPRWIAGGEPLSVSLAERFAERCPRGELLNFYGMSEASSDSLWGRCRADDVALAEALPNTTVHLLDAVLQPVPVGVIGELCVAGGALARGYLQRPRLTADRFVPSPFGPPGSRMYRTGDLARARVDGHFEILGRVDRQVKVRGVRIDISEIEDALIALDSVGQCAVVPRLSQGEQILVAYVVPAEASPLDIADLRRRAAGVLPSPMVPSQFSIVESVPLLPSGKIDRAALPDTPAAVPRPPQEALTEEEAALCRIFAELFEQPNITMESNFFDLGGHSLVVMRLVNRVRIALGVELDPGVVFDAPRIADLARHLAELRIAEPS